SGGIPRDENRVPMVAMDSFNVVKASPSAFAGGTANARGDYDGTSGSLTLFTVTGDVVVRVIGVCTTSLVGASATVEVGTTKSTAGIIAQTTGTDIDENELWHDASPDTDTELATVAPAKFIVNGGDIIEKTGTANVTAGQIYYICLWRPLSSGSSVVAA
ncbi:MAG: hypothetical protein DRN81_06790, partial [Thermoproteota archaeon]